MNKLPNEILNIIISYALTFSTYNDLRCISRDFYELLSRMENLPTIRMFNSCGCRTYTPIGYLHGIQVTKNISHRYEYDRLLIEIYRNGKQVWVHEFIDSPTCTINHSDYAISVRNDTSTIWYREYDNLTESHLCELLKIPELKHRKYIPQSIKKIGDF